MKTGSEILTHLIEKIEGLNFELDTTKGYVKSSKGNPSFAKKREDEVKELEIKIKAFEEFLKEIKE